MVPALWPLVAVSSPLPPRWRRHVIVTRDIEALPRAHYNVIYTDPAWMYYGDPDKDQAAGKHYQCMSVEEISALPVRDLMAKQSVVLCWATCPKLDVAIDVIRAWGLHYRGVTKVWAKTRADGALIHGQGVRPTTTKPTCELLLAASRQKTGRPLPIFDEGMAQVHPASRPGNKHSAKPAGIRADIERLFGDVHRLEMFAREVHLRWDAWGDQVPDPSLYDTCATLTA